MVHMVEVLVHFPVGQYNGKIAAKMQNKILIRKADIQIKIKLKPKAVQFRGSLFSILLAINTYLYNKHEAAKMTGMADT